MMQKQCKDTEYVYIYKYRVYIKYIGYLFFQE